MTEFKLKIIPPNILAELEYDFGDRWEESDAFKRNSDLVGGRKYKVWHSYQFLPQDAWGTVLLGALLEPAQSMQESNQVTTQIYATNPDWEMKSEIELDGAEWLTQTYSFLIFSWLSKQKEKVELVARVDPATKLTSRSKLELHRVSINGWSPARDFDRRPKFCLVSDLNKNFTRYNKMYSHFYNYTNARNNVD